MIIHFHIFEPHKSIFKNLKNDKAEYSYIDCSNQKNCGLYQRGECSCLAILGWHKCPYGKYSKETGPTKRSRSYGKWIEEAKQKYKEIGHLKSHSNVIAKIGDYIFLPYAHMTMNESIPFLKHSKLFAKDNCFLLKEFFTIENIINICEFKPQAFMGGEIKQYQKEVIPKFIIHLSEKMPKTFKELCIKYPKAEEICKNKNYIGRKALLKTLTPNVGFFNDVSSKWEWDGKYLTSTNKTTYLGIVNKIKEIRIEPGDNESVEITDNNQVNKNTIFLD